MIYCLNRIPQRKNRCGSRVRPRRPPAAAAGSGAYPLAQAPLEETPMVRRRATEVRHSLPASIFPSSLLLSSLELSDTQVYEPYIISQSLI